MSRLRGTLPSTLFVAAGDTFYGKFEATPHRERQEVWAAELAAKLLGKLGVVAVTPGWADLTAGHDHFAELSTESGQLTLLAGGTALSDEPGPVRASSIRTVGTAKIGLVGFSMKPEGASSNGIHAVQDPTDAAVRYVASVRRQGADFVIVLLSGTTEVANSIARRAKPDILVHGGVHQAAPSTRREHGTLVINGGRRGQHLIAADVEARTVSEVASRQLSAGSPRTYAVRVDVIELSESIPRDPEVSAELELFFDGVNEHNRRAHAEIEPLSVATGQARFVGARVCASCHTAAYLWWARSGHGRAYRTLEERNREFNLDCVACHVTGYGQAGGATVTQLGDLKNVSCESCHGAGSLHAEDPQHVDPVLERRVPKELCTACHTREHSDRFHYESYRSKLLVPGHGKPLSDGRLPEMRGRLPKPGGGAR